MGIVPFKFMPEIEADLVRVEIDMPDGTPYTRLEQIRDQLQAGIDVTMAESIKQYPNIEGGLIKDAAVVASGTRVNAWIAVQGYSRTITPECR